MSKPDTIALIAAYGAACFLAGLIGLAFMGV